MKAMPDDCRNRRCPFWNPTAEENCEHPTSPSDDWIFIYCENQGEKGDES